MNAEESMNEMMDYWVENREEIDKGLDPLSILYLSVTYPFAIPSFIYPFSVLGFEKYSSTHFPSMISDDPLPLPLGVENVKCRENSEKIREPPGGPVGTLYNPRAP